jgi:kinesin family protein C2/C3
VVAREKHIPFRNSKLTHLLQDSLSGGARSHALVLVHVSPARADVNETVNSLKFAARVCRPPQVIAGRHRVMRGELQQQRAEVSRLNQVVSVLLGW